MNIFHILNISPDNESHNGELPREESTELFRGFHAIKTFYDALMTSASMVNWGSLSSAWSHSDSHSGVAYDSVSLSTLTETSQLQDDGAREVLGNWYNYV